MKDQLSHVTASKTENGKKVTFQDLTPNLSLPCPPLRAALWEKKRRELRLLKLVRHLQALADRWLQGLFQSKVELRRFLHRACATGERLVAKASRKRRTSAQFLRESLDT